MKLNNTAIAFVGACSVASATLMPAVNAGSVILDTFWSSGAEWKLKVKNNNTLRFNKNGNVKCSNSIANVAAFYGCVVGKVGEALADRTWEVLEGEFGSLTSPF